MRLRILLGVVALAAVASFARAQPQAVTVEKASTPEKALRFEVTVPASLDDVWAAFTTSDGLRTWLWSDVRVDLRQGGDWLVLFPGSSGGGTIVSFEPKHELVVRALAPERFPTVRAVRTLAVFSFSPLTPSSTVVTLRQTGWQAGPEWDEAYEYLASGNAQLLGALKQRFETGPIDWRRQGGR